MSVAFTGLLLVASQSVPRLGHIACRKTPVRMAHADVETII
jgi:hypothetical protein